MKMKTFGVSAVISVAAFVAACTPADISKPDAAPAAPPAAPAEQAPVPGTFTETDQPITAPTWSSCIVVIDLLQTAIRDGKAQGVAGPGDLAGLEAADTAFRAKLKAAMPVESEQQQMIGSSVAFFDQLTPAQLKASVDLCVARQNSIAADDV